MIEHPDSAPLRRKFRAIAPLAMGRLGTVYRAVAADGAMVALKVFPDDVVDPQPWLPALPAHPAVATVHGLGRSGQVGYAVMDLVAGVTVAALRADGPVAPALALAIVAEVADGLAHLHAHGVVHGAIEPDHVMVDVATASPRVAIVSLDGAPVRARKAANPGLRICRGRGACVSTLPSYQPPELIRGQATGAAGDVHAAGVLLLELLTGHDPFADDDLFATMTRIIRGPPPSVPPALAALPGLAALVDHALARDPSARARASQLAASARAVRAALA